MNARLSVPLTALEEIRAVPHFAENTMFVVCVELDQFVRVHVDIEQIRIPPCQSMGDMGVNLRGIARLLIGVFQIVFVFFLILGHTKNDHFTLRFLNQCGPQAHRHGLSLQHEMVIMDKEAISAHDRQHVLPGHDAQVMLQILRRDGL